MRERSRARARLGRASTAHLTVVRICTVLALAGATIGARGGPAGASAPQPLHVFVGYADGLRGSSPSFPGPWEGDSNVVFLGGSESGAFDAGAIRIDNTSASPVSIDSLTVTVGDTSFNTAGELWSDLTVPADDGGEPGHLILTQTADYNFDTSDVGPPGDCRPPN